MDITQGAKAKISVARTTGLFCLFFLIAWGLGYPALNRYDPRQTPGLNDVKTYAAIVSGTDTPDAGYLRFRVLVPWLARPFYQLAKDRMGSWDPVMFGLLFADSLFVAATALLIVILGIRQLDSYAVSLVAALLYLVNFAVPNLRLAGLVDAGEGLFLLALLWSLSELELWALPFVAALGALTKESFIPFSIVFMAAWWIVVRKGGESPTRSATWIVSSWLVSFVAMIVLQRWIAGRWISPIEFAATLRGDGEYLQRFISSFSDRTLWYTFMWVLPFGIPNLKRFPKSWLIPTGAASAMAFILDAYHGGPPGGVARALFSVAGPVLALSSASFLVGTRDQCAFREDRHRMC